MVLQYLLEDLESKKVNKNDSIDINKIEYDSNKIEEGDIFVAIKGFEEDGHEYIEKAITNGAKAVVVENGYDYSKFDNTVIFIETENTRKALAILATRYYDYPAKKMKIIGITGTKGKTTTAYMIRNILTESGKKVGMIGSIYNTYNDVQIEAERSCPESLGLQKLLRDMADNEMEYVVMEVTSHALSLYRVYGIRFVIGVFTNLSQDHLDFHGTFDNYFEAKASLFDNADFALINSDDVYAPKLLKRITCKSAKFGIDNASNVTASDIRINNKFVEFKMYVNKMLQKITINIPGRYTVYNALGAIGVCSLLGCQMDEILKALFETKIPGRSEIVDIEKPFTVMIDFAHSPASLEAILDSTKKYAKGRIICVFGCGGDRDTEKRKIMGEISGRIADFTVITTDNPRTEKPSSIIAQIEEGVKQSKGIYKVIESRKDAIKFAMEIAWRNDIVLIVGKGHETYQEINKKKFPFDERKIVKEIASNMPDKQENIY